MQRITAFLEMNSSSKTNEECRHEHTHTDTHTETHRVKPHFGIPVLALKGLGLAEDHYPPPRLAAEIRWAVLVSCLL